MSSSAFVISGQCRNSKPSGMARPPPRMASLPASYVGPMGDRALPVCFRSGDTATPVVSDFLEILALRFWKCPKEVDRASDVDDGISQQDNG